MLAGTVRGVVAFIVGQGRTARHFDLAPVRANYEAVKPILESVADKHGIRREIFKAVAWHESEFKATARNPTSGAAGLFQIMPFHWERPGGFLNSTWGAGTWADPRANAEAGAQVLKFSGYGKDALPVVLKKYGGFVTVNPRPYIADIEGKASVFLLLGDQK